MSLYRQLGFDKARRHRQWTYLYHIERVRQAVIIAVFILGFAIFLGALLFCT
jgi:hypothetical protein